MVWIVGLAVVAILVLFALRVLPIRIAGPWGFVGPVGTEVVHHTDEAGLSQVIEGLLTGDRFDILWVGKTDDRYGGVSLATCDGAPQLDVSFKTATEQRELAEFKEAMSRFGFEVSEDSNGFNGGFGEAFRVTSLEYTLPPDAMQVLAFTKAALDHLQGDQPEGFYLSAMRFNPRSGISIERPEDPLSEIL